MNINRSTSSMNFTSTFIPYNSKKALGFYLNNLKSVTSFKPVGFYNKSAEAMQKKIGHGQIGVSVNKGGLLFAGKDTAADNCIGKILSLLDNDVKFVDGLSEVRSKSSVLDTLV